MSCAIRSELWSSNSTCKRSRLGEWIKTIQKSQKAVRAKNEFYPTVSTRWSARKMAHVDGSLSEGDAVYINVGLRTYRLQPQYQSAR